MARRFPLLVAAAFLFLSAWVDRGAIGYLLAHPSVFDTASLRWLFVQDAASVAAAALFILLCAALGLGLSRRLGDKSAALAIPLGLGILGTAVFLLGVAGFYQASAFEWLVALAALAAWLGLPSGPRLTPGRRLQLSLWTAVCAVALLCSARHALLLGLAPPTEWDVIAYHLAIPKIYLGLDGIRELPWLMHSHWPHLMEILYGLPLAAGRLEVPALLHAGAFCALIALVVVAAKEAWGELEAWTAAAVLAAQPLCLRFAGTAHSDGALALFYFAACVALWRWTRKRSYASLALAGLLAGFCACAKLHGAVLFAALALIVAWRSLKARRDLAGAAVDLALFSACGLAVVAPWYLKTWIGSGDPVWPFAAGVFGGRWGALAFTASSPFQHDWSWWLDLSRLARYGPQFLLIPALAGASAAGPRLRGSVVPVALLPALPYFAVFGSSDEFWRFCWPFLPALALAAGCGLAVAWRSRDSRLRLWAFAVLLFSAWPAATVTENNQLFAVLHLRSKASPEADPEALYLERSLGIYDFSRETSRRFPGARVLLFQEIRGFYLDVPYVWGDPTNQWVIQYSKYRDPGELFVALRRLGITHVWINEGIGMYRASPTGYTRRTIDLMDRLLRSRAKLALRVGFNSLYELLPDNRKLR